MFDFNKVVDFDKHISLSIPNYDQLFNTFRDIASIYSEPETCVVDYGCSTGKLLLELPKKHRCIYVGIDDSNLIPQMNNEIEFIKGDALLEGDIKNKTSVIISMFFLQFLPKTQRKLMVEKFKRFVDDGAILLISEKVMLDDGKFDNIISRLHIQEKRKNFTDSEILNKDREILDSMYVLKYSELMKELNYIGNVTPVWQSYNFCGFVVSR